MNGNDVQSDEQAGPLLITAAELARLLRLSKRTLWRLRSAGTLPKTSQLSGLLCAGA